MKALPGPRAARPSSRGAHKMSPSRGGSGRTYGPVLLVPVGFGALAWAVAYVTGEGELMRNVLVGGALVGVVVLVDLRQRRQHEREAAQARAVYREAQAKTRRATAAWLSSLGQTVVRVEVVEPEPTVILPVPIEQGLTLIGPILQGEVVDRREPRR